MGLTWDFNKSLSEMLDPQKAIALRPLTQAKTDIVNRNYNIVLEYQEKDKYAPLTFALSSMSMMVGTNDPGMRVQGGRQALVTYSSSAPSALSVDPQTGVLHALIVGTVTITAVEHDGAGKVFGSASYTVNVTPDTSVSSVTIKDSDGNVLTDPPIVDDTLTAVVLCVSYCIAGSFTYQWQLETSHASGEYADIAGATAPSLTILPTYQLKRVRVIVDSTNVTL
jgi:hypothetical protein